MLLITDNEEFTSYDQKNEPENFVSKHPTHRRIAHLVLFDAKRERPKLLFKTSMLFSTSSKSKAIYPSGCKGKADLHKKTGSTIREV